MSLLADKIKIDITIIIMTEKDRLNIRLHHVLMDVFSVTGF